MLIRVKSYFVIFFLACGFLYSPSIVEAKTSYLRNAERPFSVPSGLESRVNFWKLVYSKYTTNHAIIHDEDYKVNLDYASGDFIGYLEIDPNFSLNANDWKSYYDNASNNVCDGASFQIVSNPQPLLVGVNTLASSYYDCYYGVVEYDISSVSVTSDGIINDITIE